MNCGPGSTKDSTNARRRPLREIPYRRAMPAHTPAITLLWESLRSRYGRGGHAKNPTVVRMDLRAVGGDITQVDVDVIVNAANPGLLGGGGVDGAIHAAGGPSILAECRTIKERLPGGLVPRGQAVATTAGRLPARWVVHTAGPIWSASRDLSEVLRSCYVQSLRVADGLGARTVAFPAVSAGVYGWPLEDAARQAVAGVRSASVEHIQEVRFVLFSDEALAAFEAALTD